MFTFYRSESRWKISDLSINFFFFLFSENHIIGKNMRRCQIWSQIWAIWCQYACTSLRKYVIEWFWPLALFTCLVNTCLTRQENVNLNVQFITNQPIVELHARRINLKSDLSYESNIFRSLILKMLSYMACGKTRPPRQITLFMCQHGSLCGALFTSRHRREPF